jgi:hypothetical protein
MQLTGEKRSIRWKNLSQCHFVHHNPTWTEPGSNSGLRGDRPATNSLSRGKAFITFSLHQVLLLWSNPKGEDVGNVALR